MQRWWPTKGNGTESLCSSNDIYLINILVNLPKGTARVTQYVVKKNTKVAGEMMAELL